MKSKVLLLAFCFLLSVFNVSAEKTYKGIRYTDLNNGQSLNGTIDLSGSFAEQSENFRIRIPKNAYGLRISLSGASADLDLFINPGAPAEQASEALYIAETEDYNEELFVTRMDEPGLDTGIYFVKVAYQFDYLPVIDGETHTSVDFSIKCEIISADPQVTVLEGQRYDLELLPENGMYLTAAVNIPAGTESVRIDVFDTKADIDIFASMKTPAKTRVEAMYAAESLLGNESLVIRGMDGARLIPGKYFISFTDQVVHDIPQKFSVYITYGPEAPADLLQIPSAPSEDSSFGSALQSVVEVISSKGKGSGCLVSSDGLIITNWHVIRGPDGNPSEELYAALTFDERYPPQELFSLSVLEYDEELDLALLKVSGGLYGQELPYGYSFPFLSIGDSSKLRIGQPVGTIGFPAIGGSGSRTSVTFTTGIVSGFELTSSGLLVKTDSLINSGNSGGAVIDSYFELIGFPGFVIDSDNSSMGYIYPVSMIPEAWMRMIKAAS